MTIDWNQFTPLSAISGGILIGLGSAALAIFNGRIAGISGIIGQLMNIKSAPKNHFTWRLLFILGLLISPWVYKLFATLPTSTISASLPELLLAGLLVGIGTRMGSGCTSGHGVCGLGRLSIRSLIATMSFMFTGFVICFVLLHLIK
jgi:uncharacterized membrane protein YedE/YeeE